MLNIYDEPLQPCGTSSMQVVHGMMNLNDEKGGGVHQICIDNMTNNAPQFSESTGQSNWWIKGEMIIIVFVWELGHYIIQNQLKRGKN